jgi:hypothetical protein
MAEQARKTVEFSVGWRLAASSAATCSAREARKTVSRRAVDPRLLNPRLLNPRLLNPRDARECGGGGRRTRANLVGWASHGSSLRTAQSRALGMRVG